MLSEEEFDSLKVDDVVETDSIMAGLTAEPTKLRVADITEKAKAFVVTWCGITLGRWVATKTEKGEIEWTL